MVMTMMVKAETALELARIAKINGMVNTAPSFTKWAREVKARVRDLFVALGSVCSCPLSISNISIRKHIYLLEVCLVSLPALIPKKRERILHGLMTFLILRSLIDGPSHGYALENYLSQKLKKPIPPGTIYVILSSLKEDGLVSLKERTVVNGRAVTTYELTPLGREFLLDHKEPMKVMKEVAEELIRAIDDL